MREEDRIPQNQHEEETVAVLLSHLQQMRRAVPVNYQLKSELKKQLLQRMKELDVTNGQPAYTQAGGQRKWWVRVGIGLLVLALGIGGYGWWQKNSLTVSEKIVLQLPDRTSVEQVDMDTTGTTLAYVDDQKEIRTISLRGEEESSAVKLPSPTGKYQALSWAHNGNQLAVVEEGQQQSRMWIVNVPDQNNSGSSRLLKEEDGVRYSSPSWSPNDETVAYTRWKDGTEEIWVSSTVSFQEWKLAEGSQPEWSADGRYLAFVKAGNVLALEIRSGIVIELGQGEWPSWSSDNQLTYTASSGKLVEVDLGEETPTARDLSIHTRADAHLVRAGWSVDGRQLLLAHRLEQANTLIISLASR